MLNNSQYYSLEAFPKNIQVISEYVVSYLKKKKKRENSTRTKSQHLDLWVTKGLSLSWTVNTNLSSGPKPHFWREQWLSLASLPLLLQPYLSLPLFLIYSCIWWSALWGEKDSRWILSTRAGHGHVLSFLGSCLLSGSQKSWLGSS